MTESKRTAVYKATGVLAREILAVLEDREDAPLGALVLVDTAREAVRLKGNRLECGPASAERLDGVTVGLLGGRESGLAVASVVGLGDVGVLVDPAQAELPAHRGVLEIPRAGALLVGRVARALAARRVVATVLEPAAEQGPAALTELYEQTMGLFGQRELPSTVFGGRLAFNVLPGRVPTRGVELAGCPVSVSTLLVPVMAGTTVSLEAELAARLDGEALVDALEDAGIEVHDAVDPAAVVGESSVRATVLGNDGLRVRLVVVADEARLLAEALVALGARLHDPAAAEV